MPALIEKVVMYYPRALHGDGGVTNSLWLWAESLRRACVDVQVVYDPRLPPLQERCVPPGVHTLPIPHFSRGRFGIPWRLGHVLDASVLLVLHSGYVLFNLMAGEVARRCRAPYVVMSHGAYDPHVRQSRCAVRSAWEIAERRLLTKALATHVFFEPEVDHVRQLAPEAATLISPTAFQLPAAQWDQARAADYVAWLGRYDVRHKGLDRLLDAMALLPVNHRPYLRMHGRDHKDSRRSVQEMVAHRGLAEHVSVGGSIAGADKQRFLLGAAAYVHPARWESYGLALVENLAHGVPCVTTTDTNLSAVLVDGDSALVVDGSVEGLAGALRAVAAGEAWSYGPRGREFVHSHLSHEVASTKFLSGVEKLMIAEVAR